jgi:hypothetical protein
MFGLVYNIIHNAFKRKEYRVLFAGVDGAGKTVRFLTTLALPGPRAV